MANTAKRITAHALLCGIALLSAMSGPVSAGTEEFVGKASVIDGDTIEIRGQRIRLEGFDAPESAQLCYAGDQAVRCGQQAALYLDSLLDGKTVSCKSTSRDRYNRVLATCSFDNVDVGAVMVENGQAVAYRRYSQRYIPHEARAQAAARGIWSMSFAAPWDWRRSQ
jgi:endonuclease YncB( thermonuclease family)